MISRLLAAMALFVCHTSAFALQEFAVTREELAMMPPYCTARLGRQAGLPPFEASPLRNTVPLSCYFVIHHYCDGLKDMIRVHTATDPNESDYWRGQAEGAINSVIVEWDQKNPDCPLRADAYLNLGKAQLLKTRRHHGAPAQAALNFSRALELKPDYVDAYDALSDLYREEGNKRKALSVVEDGLRHVPDAKGLLRRFKALGGKTPPTPIAAAPKPESVGDQNKAATHEQPVTNQANGEKPPPDTSEPDKIGKPGNPYCRFCPP